MGQRTVAAVVSLTALAVTACGDDPDRVSSGADETLAAPADDPGAGTPPSDSSDGDSSPVVETDGDSVPSRDRTDADATTTSTTLVLVAPTTSPPAPTKPTPTEPPPTPSTEPDPTSETTMPDPIPDELAHSPMVQFAIADLRERLADPAAAIGVVSVNEVEWPDGSLGCPQPDMAYTQVVVNGSKIVLSHGGIRYDYHQGGGGDPFYCPPGTGASN
jgi:hypothetical protein